jgi:sugar/nucleoside kinase (ribokinase family)
MAGETSAASPRSQEHCHPSGKEKTLLLGLGVCTLDCIQPVEEFPTADHVVHCSGSLLMGGGPVTTALVAAARLGTHSAVIDRIGDDWRGNHVRDEFERADIDTRWLVSEKNATTAFANVMARRSDAARAIVFTSGSAREFSDADIADVPFEKAAALHLNGRHWPACLNAADRTHAGGGIVSFDGGAHRYRDEIRELLPKIDIAIVAREFSAHLTSDENASVEDRLAALLDFGVRISGITDGERGSWFATSDTATGEIFHQPAFPVQPTVDTTGCGDVFHGAFLAEWLHSNGDLHSSARLASAAAALNATALGGRGHLADRDELDQFLAAHKTTA